MLCRLACCLLMYVPLVYQDTTAYQALYLKKHMCHVAFDGVDMIVYKRAYAGLDAIAWGTDAVVSSIPGDFIRHIKVTVSYDEACIPVHYL